MVLGFGAWCLLATCRASARSEAYDPLTMDFPVSPSQARSAVRDLVGDPEMNLRIRDVSLPDDFSSDLDYWIDEANGDHCFAVGAEDGWVSSWFNRIAQRQLGEHETEFGPSSQLPEPVLVAMAEAFAAAHYPDFTGLNMQQPYPGYFSWVGRLSANVWNLSAVCMVGVDRWTGEVHTFLRRKPLPVTISTTPLISGASAEDIALDYLLQQPDVQTAFVLDNNGYCWVHHDSLGGQRLVYEIVFVTHGDADYTPAMYVAELEGPEPLSAVLLVAQVDALTGETLGAYDVSPLGKDEKGARPPSNVRASHRRTLPAAVTPNRAPFLLVADANGPVGCMYPPLLLDGKAYLYVGYLASLKGGEVKWKDGQAVLTLRGREYRLRPGSAEVSGGGEMVRLSGVVRNLRGRVYVPVDAFPKLAGLKAGYDAKSRTVHLTTGRKRLAPAPAAD